MEVSLQRLPAAETHLLQAISINPHFALAYDDLASLYLVEHRNAQAEQTLAKGLEQVPDSIELDLRQADLAFRNQEQTKAEALLERLRQRQPKSIPAALAIGDLLVAHRQLDPAVVEYRRGLNLEPNSIQLRQRLVDVYLAQNRIDEAAVINDEDFRRRPKDVAAAIAHGRIYFARGKREEAIATLSQAVAAAPDSVAGHYFLGAAYKADNRLEEAKQELQRALNIAPHHPDLLGSLAQLTLGMGDAGLAENYARQAVAADPGAAPTHQVLGNVYYQEHRFNDARQQFLAAEPLTSRPGQVQLQLALADTGAQQWQKAEQEFKAALEQEPHFTEALRQFANYWVRRGQPQRALALVDQYLASTPNDNGAYLLKGSLLFNSGKVAESKPEFERVLAADGKSAEALLQLGRVAQAEKNRRAAITYYERALQQQPKFVPLLTLVGNLYSDDGDLKMAEKYYQQALAADPHFAPAAGNLAWTYAKQKDGNLDLALSLAQSANHLAPQLVPITDTLGWVEYRRGSYGAALPLFEQCVEHAPGEPLYRFHLGLALIATGQADKARNELRTALRLNLSGDDAARARSELARAER
jgi:tetratricopeptide (TPR) repeat protein